MSIPFRALIGLETSASRILRAELEPATARLGLDVMDALRHAAPDKAWEQIEQFHLTAPTGRALPALEELAFSTAVFGASQSRAAPDTLFMKGRSKHLTTVFKAAAQSARIAEKVGVRTVQRSMERLLSARSPRESRTALHKSFEPLCCGFHALRVPLLKAPRPTFVVPDDMDDFSDLLNAATLSGGRLAADVAANTTTTRLAAYGYLAQAVEDGKTKYEITAVLDDRTCPVCTYMHGKELDIETALVQTEAALNADDPDDIEGIAPWPGQSKAALRDFLTMDTEALQDAGYMVPPFHPACRCILVDVGVAEKTIAPRTPAAVATLFDGPRWFDKLIATVLGPRSKEGDDWDETFDDL